VTLYGLQTHNAEEIVARRTVDVAVIIPDASPVLTLARIGRLDLFDTFTAPIHIVDQVRYEITKEANDPRGEVNAWLQRMGNRVIIEETFVGLVSKQKLNAARRRAVPISGRLQLTSTQRGWRYTARRALCRSSCLKIPMCSKRELRGCRACTS